MKIKKMMIVLVIVVLIYVAYLSIKIYNIYYRVSEFDIDTYISEIDNSLDIVLGKVNNAKEAKQKAQAIFIEIYGKEITEKNSPFIAKYDKANKMWLIQGTFEFKCYFSSNYVCKGGVAHILIREEDGKVLAVWHDK